MPIITNNEVCSLYELISQGFKIILFDSDDSVLLASISSILNAQDMVKVKIWHSIETFLDSNCIVLISRKQLDNVLQLYRLYDFSDRVITVSDNFQYGSLYNYMKTGIITKEEMIEALLYKI